MRILVKLFILCIVLSSCPHLGTSSHSSERNTYESKQNGFMNDPLVVLQEDSIDWFLLEFKKIYEAVQTYFKLADKGTWTPLMQAAQRGNATHCRLLISRCAHVNDVDEYGTTALMLAASRGHLEVCRLLVEKGADRRAVNQDGKIALNYSAHYGNQALDELLEPSWIGDAYTQYQQAARFTLDCGTVQCVSSVILFICFSWVAHWCYTRLKAKVFICFLWVAHRCDTRLKAKKTSLLSTGFMLEAEKEALKALRQLYSRSYVMTAGQNQYMDRAQKLCDDYTRTLEELSSAKCQIELALASAQGPGKGQKELADEFRRGGPNEKMLKDRDKAYDTHLECCRKLVKACKGKVLDTVKKCKEEVNMKETSTLNELIESLAIADGNAIPDTDGLQQAEGAAQIEPSLDAHSGGVRSRRDERHMHDIIKETLDEHDKWMQEKRNENLNFIKECKSKLGQELDALGRELQTIGHDDLSVQDVQQRLVDTMHSWQNSIAQEEWDLRLYQQYRQISRKISQALVQIVKKRKREYGQLDHLEKCAKRAGEFCQASKTQHVTLVWFSQAFLAAAGLSFFVTSASYWLTWMVCRQALQGTYWLWSVCLLVLMCPTAITFLQSARGSLAYGWIKAAAEARGGTFAVRVLECVADAGNCMLVLVEEVLSRLMLLTWVRPLKSAYHVLLGKGRLTPDQSLLDKLKGICQSKRQDELNNVWREVYQLSLFFPELPLLAVDNSTRAGGLKLLAFVDAALANFVAPARRLDMYKDVKTIAVAGRESRNNVLSAKHGDAMVCLKEFKLGSMSDSERELRAKVRTFQRELANVSKLKHDHVIKADFFFLHQGEHNNLCIYVQYPYYACGNMSTWLTTVDQKADAPKIRIVLGDVLNGLEHVHYLGIVHCDVKLANVLVKEQGEQFRGILTDFDLSKDDTARKEETQASARSMSVSVLGPRGTLGNLTMAPEVMEGTAPSAASDVFSFGGMVFSALFTSQSEQWERVDEKGRWETDGTAILACVGDGDDGARAKALLGKLLHRKPERRVTSMEAAADPFFNADLSSRELLAVLEKTTKLLEQEKAKHKKEVDEQRRHNDELVSNLERASGELRERKLAQDQKMQQERDRLQKELEHLQRSGQLNEEARARLEKDKKQLESERQSNKANNDKEAERLRKEEQRIAKEAREEKNRLAAELKKIDERSKDVLMKEKELANKERDVALRETEIRVPGWWKNLVGFHLEQSPYVRDAFEAFLRDTWCCTAPKSAKVVRVERIENEDLWRTYQTRRGILQRNLKKCSFPELAGVTTKQPNVPSAKDLDKGVNEFYLFHGTSSSKARTIAEHGFDERVAGMGGLYGAGSYFASAACKSHQYANNCKDSSDWVIMVCRVTMGWAYGTKSKHNNARRPPDNPGTPGRPFDSIFALGGVANGGDQRHNEYIVFDKCQVYPEYLVHYQV